MLHWHDPNQHERIIELILIRSICLIYCATQLTYVLPKLQEVSHILIDSQKRFHWEKFIKTNPQLLIIQSSADITRSNLTRHCTDHRRNWGGISEDEHKKETPYLSLAGELWSVFRNILEKVDYVIMAPLCTVHFHKHDRKSWCCCGAPHSLRTISVPCCGTGGCCQ